MGASISILLACKETDGETNNETCECCASNDALDISTVFFFIDSNSLVICFVHIFCHLGYFRFCKGHGSPPDVKWLFIQYSNIYFKKVERHRYLG